MIGKYIFFLSMTSKVIEGHKSSSNFSVHPTLPLLDGPLMPLVCGSFSPSLSHSLSLFLFLSPKVPLLLLLMQIYRRFRPCFELKRQK